MRKNCYVRQNKISKANLKQNYPWISKCFVFHLKEHFSITIFFSKNIDFLTLFNTNPGKNYMYIYGHILYIIIYNCK